MSADIIQIKNRAKELIRTSKPGLIPVTGIYLGIFLLLSFLIFTLLGYANTDAIEKAYAYYSNSEVEKAYETLLPIMPSGFQSFSAILLELTLLVLKAGYIIFIYNSLREQEPCVANLLDGYPMALKVIFLYIMEAIVILLGTLLFIIPGIVLFYCYRHSLFILIDNPKSGVFDCMRQSRLQMKDHKLELFMLDLSFIALIVLKSIGLIGFISQLFSLPYMQSSYLIYYESLKNVHSE